jgi:signal transduction histidine kinase
MTTDLRSALALASYQTNWFRLLRALGGAVAIWLFYRLRLKQVTARVNLQYQERLSERTRIARELHDTLLQSLAGVSLQLDGISKNLVSVVDARSRITFVREQVDSCLREARLKVWDLSSPDLEAHGLPGMLRSFVQRVAPASKASCQFSVIGERHACRPPIEEELFRIAQQAVNNAIRHADANRIGVALVYEDRGLRLQVSDNGRGFDLEKCRRLAGHWGLKNMQERAAQIGASCKIRTAAGCGTKVEVFFNFNQRSRDARSSYSHIDC